MSFNHFLHEHMLLPMSDVVTGQQVSRYLSAVELAESWPDEMMRAYQEDRLHKLIVYSAAKVPFYRDWFSAHGLNPVVARLEELPIISKALVRQEGIERFAAEGFPLKQRVISRSSGSTDAPFSFYESKLSYSVNVAAKLRTWYQAGYRLGDCYMKIAGKAPHSRLKSLQDKVNNCVFVPFASINDENLKNILDLIEKKQPSFIRSYPLPLFMLAQYRIAHGGYDFIPQHVMTTGSTLTDAYQEIIERAFGCDVIDPYSCEGTPNVYETIAHDGYHVTEYCGIIEVLDEQNQKVSDGIGRVVSTDLWNYAMPFIRYDTQDLVEVKDGKIVRVLGRESDVLVNDDGNYYTTFNFSHYFLFDVVTVDSYQIVKHKDQSVTFRLVVNNRYDACDEQNIIKYWSKELGVPVDVVLVDEIPLMNNNKRIVIIDETVE